MTYSLKHNKLSKSKIGSNNPQWRGGRVLKDDGYVIVKQWDHPNCSNKGYVLEHRLVMEEHLGRHLNKKEIVYHKNGIKNDNRIENLELFKSQSDHLKHHQPKGSPLCIMKGEKHPIAKLTEKEVLDIRDKFDTSIFGEKARLAREYNVSFSTIHKIVNNEPWKHI